MTREKFIVLDVEGMQGKRPYNVGYIIADRYGKIYKKHSFAFPACIWENIAESLRIGQAVEMTKKNIQEILLDSDKPRRKRKYKSVTTEEFANQFFKEIHRYKVKRIFAYNCNFDKGAISRLLGEELFAELDCEWCDIISGLLPRFCTAPYLNFCLTNGYLSPKGIAQYKAEIAYRYFFGDLNFEEEHTGLEDALIEYALLLISFKSHKKLDFKPVCAWAQIKKAMQERDLWAVA